MNVLSYARRQPVAPAWPWLLVLGAWLLPGMLLLGTLGIFVLGLPLTLLSLPVGLTLGLLSMSCALLGIVSVRRHVHGAVLILCVLALPMDLGLLLLLA